jgi:hypothetical protein
MKPRVRLLTGPTISGKGQGTRGRSPRRRGRPGTRASRGESRACGSRILLSDAETGLRHTHARRVSSSARRSWSFTGMDEAVLLPRGA